MNITVLVFCLLKTSSFRSVERSSKSYRKLLKNRGQKSIFVEVD